MKITKSQLEQIISEEISTLSEEENLDEVFGLLRKGADYLKKALGRGPKTSDTEKKPGSTLNQQSIRTMISAGAKSGDPADLEKALEQVFKSLEEAGVEKNNLRTARNAALKQLKKFKLISQGAKQPEEKQDAPGKVKEEALLREGIEDLDEAVDKLVKAVKDKEMTYRKAFNIFAGSLIQFMSDLLPNTKQPAKVAGPEAAPAGEEPAAGKPSGEEEEPAAGKPSGEEGESAKPEEKPAQDKKKKEVYIGDIKAALNQIENLGGFNPKELLQSLDKMKKQVQSSLNPINKTLKDPRPTDKDKNAIKHIGEEFKNNALSKVASAFDEAESYIRDYYKKLGFDGRLNESRSRGLSKGAARVLLILLEKEIKEKKTLQDDFNDRGERLYEALMKKFIK